ncbi:MAG: hypothetical protein V4618_11785 [Pseudomonadota bacterium]
MADPACDTRMLQKLRSSALVQAAAATDPLIRQQYVDLAQSYATTATELREHGAAVMPPASMTRMPWRSVSLWVTNDH